MLCPCVVGTLASPSTAELRLPQHGPWHLLSSSTTAPVTARFCPLSSYATVGAMDLSTKAAYKAMTPLEKVFMLSSDQKLDDSTVEAIMSAKPFSRVPVYRGDNRKDIIG